MCANTLHITSPHRIYRLLRLWLWAGLLWAGSASAATLLQVGPQRALKTIAAAAKLAGDDTVIEVDAGDYVGDVAVWTQSDITLRAVGGRVRLLANGMAAEGKGIWVVRSPKFTVDGFDFSGAQVESRNGAGIRFETGWLVVRNCSFTRNEMGLLTNNDPAAVLEVENSEFAYNMRPDGHNHNLYIGRIARASVTGSYFHHAHIGHLLKSRAATSYILYNRLTDESGGSASYELEFSNGGLAYVVGNIIQQGPLTENPHMVSFGAEGYTWPSNQLYLSHNTLVDDLSGGGIWLRVKPGADALLAVNNLFVGPSPLPTEPAASWRNNFRLDRSAFGQGDDYRLRSDSPLVGKAITPGTANGQSLLPQREYIHPLQSVVLRNAPHNPGALQQLKPARP
jgi:hypothetical protein